ncbi:P-loop containing nucleoside triphosphate hydrolase protein [Penicillium angulare]|uniref:P-loop containing nucleoside triphosphate hydrolase protein n=1 Tax=Penicillium angulare TaxID=116970 RepID=A0A9W9FI32_9EURO|nr:P-loop containing nucleoside triphosphate hydrolase protein [Penicillium angulare]
MAMDDQTPANLSSDSSHKGTIPKQPQRTPTVNDYLRVFTYATSWDKLVLAAGILAAMGSGFTQPLMFILFGNFVNEFNGARTVDATADFNTTQKTLNHLCLLVFALFLARFGLASIHKFAFRMIGIRLLAALRLHYLKHLLDQEIHVLDSLPSGYAVGTITSSSSILQGGISEKLAILIEYTTLIVGSFIVAFVWSWELSLVTLSGFFAVVIVAGSLFPLTVKGQTRQMEVEKKAASLASECFSSMKMIMACGAQRQIIEKYNCFIEKARKHAQSTNVFTSLQFSLTFFGVFGTIALAFWYGALIFTKNRLDNVGVITVVLLCLATIFFSLDRVTSPLQAIGKASIAAYEYFSVIDAPIGKRGTLKAPHISAREDIEFENVTFAYPSRPEVKILDQLNLRIEAGKMTAIVGPSGSGKSTIVGLIECWYSLKRRHVIGIPKSSDAEEDVNASKNDSTVDNGGIDGAKVGRTEDPTELQGAVTTCGHSLENIDVKWWRSRIGLVQQEPFLFNDTIFLNVARGFMGTPWEGDSDEQKRKRVIEACQEAFADEFIKRLPLGYDTCIGDGGARLSGGQRQRLAIARSIIKKPDILILDEATSAIDVLGQRIVQRALDNAARNRTTIVIAHRLSTIKNADRIVVLQKGKVVESGSHKSLLSREGGVYSGLVNSQTLSLGERIEKSESSTDPDQLDTLKPEQRETTKSADNTLKSDKKQPIHRSIFGSFPQLFLESKSHWNIMILGLIVSAAAGTAQPMYAWMYARSISLFKWQNDHTKLMNEFSFTGIMWTVFAISAGLAYLITFLCYGHIASFIRAKYQTKYFSSLIHQKAAYFNKDGHSHGTLIARVRDDPQKLEEMMGPNLAQVCIAIFNIIGGLIMSLVYNWKLALVSICAVAPICVLSGYIRFRYELQFENMNDAVFAESSQFASEAIGAFRTVTSLTLESSISDRFEKLCEEHVRSAYNKARWVSVILGFSESTNLGCQALILYYGGRLLTQGDISTMAFFVCLMAIMNAAEGFGKSLSFGPNAAQATMASDRILDTSHSSLMEPFEEDDILIEADGVEIELRGICLRYPGQEIPVLNNLNMTIGKGQCAALVGASGCGKTSIISLLERFYEPEEGQILVNGIDISKVNIDAYRRHLSLVAQESTLFQGTIHENILLGIDPGTVTDSQIYAACRDALIHDFIVSLPESYNTNIGSRGITLSGGQKQRIAIARALIRNPRILLLDEATSSLDSESERMAQAAIERAANGRTIIAVAHRLVTVQNADIIFVLGEGGKVMEKGNHAELLGNRGVYYQMCVVAIENWAIL